MYLQGNTNLFRNKILPGMVALATMFISQTLCAQKSADNYEMSFVANKAHGDLLEKGRYGMAIQLLSGKTGNPLATSINLCVAEVMAGKFRDARRDCTRAVKLGERAANTAMESNRDELYKNWVVALSNRGVLRAIRNQSGAEEDFRHAIELRIYADTASRNMARFNSKVGREVVSR